MNQVGLNSNRILNFKAAQTMQMQQQYPQMQYEQQLPNVKIPAMYQNPDSNSKGGFLDTLKKVDMMGLIYPWFEHPLMMLGTCFGLSWGVDKFSKACSGEYEKSLVGKAAKLGDRVEESKFVQSKPFQSTLSGIKKAVGKVGNIFKNSDVVNAWKNTPTSPEWAFVKDELLNMEQRVVHDFSNVTEKLINPSYKDGTQFVKLKDLRVDKYDKEFIEKFFSKATQSEETISNAIQLKRLGLADDAIREILSKPNSTELVKSKYFETLGIDEEFLQKLKKNPATKEDIAKVREACKKANGARIGAGHQKILGKFQPFERTIGLDEVGNRLVSMGESKTKTGRAFSKFLQRCHRGFTFGGGKMGVLLFVSPILVETMLNTKKAEPNEKVGTAVHGLINAMSWVFTFPLGLAIMHRFTGMKHSGLSADKVKESSNLIKEFNEKVKANGFASHSEYKDAKKALKDKLKTLRATKDQNLLTKICKKVGSFLTMDLETIKPYKGSNTFANIGRKIPNFLRNLGGVPMRVGLWAALTMGVLDTLINKGIKGCFGGHYDGMKEEEHEEGKKAQKEFLKEDLRARLLEAQKQKVYGAMAQQNAIQPEVEVPQELNQTIQENKPEQIQTQGENGSEPVEQEQNIKKPETVDTNKQVEETKPEKEQQNAKQAVAPVIANQIAETKLQQKEEAVVKQPEEITEPVDKYNYVPSTKPVKTKTVENVKRDNYTYIPSSENVIKSEENTKDTNKYIPSQRAANINKNFDNSGLADALKRADRAEQKALRTLAGDFGSY